MPPPDAFRTVIVTTSEHDAHVQIAKHYAGDDSFVRVRQVGEHTWAVDVAEVAT